VDARPRNGEAIGPHAELLEQVEVFFVAVVVIGGNVTGVAVEDLATVVREGVPDRWCAPIFGNGPFGSGKRP
jgi:uncharacterized protein related to proFAR isomerase